VTRRARILTLILAAVVVVLLLPGALLAWLLTTQSGLERVVAVVEGLDAPAIRIEGARGRLAGPLRAERFELATDRVAIEARGIGLDHAPLALLFGRVAVDRLHAEALSVAITAGDGGPGTPGPPRFLPRWLSVHVAEARVADARLELPGREAIVLTDLTATGSVTHRRLDLEHLALATEQGSVSGTLHLVARRPLRLRGEVDWRLATTPSLAGALRADGDLDRLELSARAAEPDAAELTATLEDLGPDLRFRARAGSPALDLSRWVSGVPLGPLALALEGSGSLRALEASAQVTATGLPTGGVQLETRLAFTAGGIDVERLEAVASAGATRVAASGRLELGAEPSLRIAADWAGLSWPIEGEALVASPAGRLEVSGWRQVAYRLNGSFAPAGGPAFEAAAAGTADGSGIEAAQAALTSGSLTMRGAAFIGFGVERPWRVEAQVRGLDLAAVRPGLDSRLTFDVAASGRGLGEQAAWAAYLGPLSGRLRDWPVSGFGFVRHQPGLTDFERFAFDIAGARVNAEGRLGAATRFDARIEADDLSTLLPELGGSIEARAGLRSAGAAAADRSALRADVALKGRDIRWREDHAAVLSLDADVDLSDRESSWARLRAAGVTVAGQDLQSARLALDGRVVDHRVELQVGAGERAVDLLGEGAFAEETYRLIATRIHSSAPVLEPWSLENPLRLTAGRESARLQETCFVSAPRRVCIEARWDAGQGWSAGVATRAFPLEALDVELPGRPGYTGVFDLAAEIQGRPDEPWTADLLATVREGRLSYLTARGRREQIGLGTLELRGRSLPARHELRVSSRDSEALDLEAELAVERRPGLSLAESPINGRLQASTGQIALLPLLVPDIDRAGGRLEARLGVAGSVDVPVLSGRVLLEDGSLDFYQSNLRLTGLTSRIDFADQGLELAASGKAGDGGFRVDGRLRWQDRILRGTLSLEGERLLVADIPELRVEASPDLDFRIDGREVEVTGTVIVPAARIEPRELVGAVAASTDERIVGADADQDAARGYRVSTELRLVLGEQVRLDAFGLRGRLAGSLRASTRPDEVTVASGELSIEDGTYRAYNRRLDVERGRLIFAGGPVGDPGVDLRASREVPGYTVGVIARGRLRRPELNLFSDPSLPQSQIASLLLVGRTLDSLQAGDRRAIGGSTSDVATQGGALLAGQIGRYVGLDEVSVQTDTSLDASLVLGKFLSPRLYVSYGISLTEAINTFKMRYTIGDNWVISAEAGRDTAVDVEYTIDR